MKNNKNQPLAFIQKEPTLFIVAGLFILFFILSLLSRGTYGGADDYVHYRFARWAFVHPSLFLDHWAKPVFTILASPFAQFGYMGIKTFNLILGVATAWLTCRICRNFNVSYSWVAIFMVCFAPIYLCMLLSGMTEILFGFVIILALFLALRGNLIGSAIILSLLPFVRNEGIVIIPFFIIYYVLNRKYSAIPFLFSGFVFFSLLGYPTYHNLFWVITNMPYTGAKDIYGSGPLLHFVNETKSIFGIPLAILFLAGLAVICYQSFKQRTTWEEYIHSQPFFILLLIISPILAYFSTHSILWWQGWGGSLGLTRVMAGIVPLFAVVAMMGLGGILGIMLKGWTKILLVLGVLYLLISTPFKIYQIPVPLDESQKIMQEVARWVHKQGFDKQRIYYYDPYFCFSLNIDPFDPERIQEKVPDSKVPSKDVLIGSVIIWDAHFGSVDGHMPLERMMNDSLLTLKKVFRPQHPFTVFNGINYEVCVFERIKEKN